MSADDAEADNDREPAGSRSTAPEPQDPLRFAEIGLQILGLYFSYKNDEAATFAVTALIEIIRLVRR
jgi:hypothetical protein